MCNYKSLVAIAISACSAPVALTPINSRVEQAELSLQRQEIYIRGIVSLRFFIIAAVAAAATRDFKIRHNGLTATVGRG